jgi:fatty-acyl-CoA synthase
LDPRALLGGSARLVKRAGDEAYFAALCVRSGLLGAVPPRQLARQLIAFEHYGMLGGALAVAATRHRDRVAMIDERGQITYNELDQRSNALANAWRERGLVPGAGVAILVRNHRGFLEAVFATAKCGARIILLNTSFAGPQIRDVAGREGTDLLVYDDEYAEMLEGVDPPIGRWRAWTDDGSSATAADTLDALIATGDTGRPPRPGTTSKITILTSGTTGTPKGAPRSQPRSLSLIGGLFSKVPFRSREMTVLGAPMFHALGMFQAFVAIALGSTLVVTRRFDPEEALASIDRERATALVVVPVMLRRMLDLGDETLARYDHSSLRIVFVSGSALGADLARRATAAFGPVIYNLYGSTEVAYATIATPAELEAEPSTVGSVVRGSVVKILDEHGEEVPTGTKGRIFVGASTQFEGYTGGGGKEAVGGLMSSGDVGHFDGRRWLFIDGRDDEMIISGGENVFPAEVEELLVRHGAIAEAAAIGVDDEAFGQRLKAFVVLHGGAQLSEDEIKRYVKENLANYKVPREVVFVDVLPRNATGKVLKRALLEQPTS